MSNDVIGIFNPLNTHCAKSENEKKDKFNNNLSKAENCIKKAESEFLQGESYMNTIKKMDKNDLRLFSFLHNTCHSALRHFQNSVDFYIEAAEHFEAAATQADIYEKQIGLKIEASEMHLKAQQKKAFVNFVMRHLILLKHLQKSRSPLTKTEDKEKKPK